MCDSNECKRGKKMAILSNNKHFLPLSLQCVAAVLAVCRSVLVEEAAFGRHG